MKLFYRWYEIIISCNPIFNAINEGAHVFLCNYLTTHNQNLYAIIISDAVAMILWSWENLVYSAIKNSNFSIPKHLGAKNNF